MGKKRVWVNLALAIVVGGGTLYGLTNSVGPLPALAPAINPGTGVWTDAKPERLLPQDEQLALPGLQKPVSILFERDGTPHIKAETNRDAWLAAGYLHAKFRLTQMDLMRRQGAGLLSEVIGEGALEADKMQRQLGLSRAAEAEWAAIEKDSPAYEVLTAYAEGVNAVIAEQEASGDLPMMFKFMGYEPTPWKPQDTLVIKGVLNQMMSFTGLPLFYTMWEQSLGTERAEAFFPVLPSYEQSAFAKGPYQKAKLDLMPLSAEQWYQEQTVNKTAVQSQTAQQTIAAASNSTENSLSDSLLLAAAGSVIERIEGLPDYAIHKDPNSNAWAVDGTKTATGQPLLAGDPHLTHSMPSVWYQIDLDAPDYKYSGATVPGLPFALIGKNEDISWTMTSGQTQQTFFYQEKTEAAHPNQYYWKGGWHDFVTRVEEIPLKGGGVEEVEIKSTIHGPLVSDLFGMELSLNWIGAFPNKGFDTLLSVMKADDFSDFKSAFQGWSAPTMNFVYGDVKGNIGLISAGVYPQFAEGTKPYKVMRGTGEDDIIGKIPYDEIPQVYNPTDHIIGSANQRQVTNDYPYYIGPMMGFAANYRAERIYQLLTAKDKLTADDMAAMQADIYDPLASRITPALLTALAGADLNAEEKAAQGLLADWEYQMKVDSSAASIWDTFWDKYVHNILDPHWKDAKVPVDKYAELKVFPQDAATSTAIEQWTLHEPDNKFFDNPVTGEDRDANQVMVAAFRETVKEIQQKLGNDASNWVWGNLHTRTFAALSQLPALGYGPRKAEGGDNTLNVAGELDAHHGPTWRMITDFGTGTTVASYPGGQSENAISPWFDDRIEEWWEVGHRELITYDETEAAGSAVHWALQPQATK